jgi:hypothetical protein
MARIEILHNVSRDASFGLNTVLRTSATKPESVERVLELSDGRYCWKDMAATPDERHELAWVFQYEDGYNGDRASAYELLNIAFETFNVGSDELAAQYRARRLRSLSVGDVVVIDGQAFSCESAGWAERSLSELNVLPAREAERVIRQRYEFGPREQLAVTVPLPD